MSAVTGGVPAGADDHPVFDATAEKTAWPPLPRAALEGVKSRSRAVLAFQHASACRALSVADVKGERCPKLSLSSRVAVQSLDVGSLVESLTAPRETEEVSWTTWRHEGLRVAVLVGADAGAELQAAAELRPHVLAVRELALNATRGLTEVLAGFSGAVLILLDAGAQRPTGALKRLGIASIWAADDTGASAGLAQVPLTGCKVLEDIPLCRLQTEVELAPLVAAAEPIYQEYFDKGFLEEVSTFKNALTAFLVPDDNESELLGFIVYKFRNYLKTVFVNRVGVPRREQRQGHGKTLMQWLTQKARRMPRDLCMKVILAPTESAIPFYERVGFVQLPPEEGDEGIPYLQYKLGRAYVRPRRLGKLAGGGAA